MSSKSPIFFGWWVVFAACFGMLFGSYSVFIGVSFALFVKPLEAAFEWTRTEISFALTLCTYTIVVLAPVIGDLIDRFGARRVLLTSMAVLGFVIASLSQLTPNLWLLYSLYILIGVVGAGTIPTTFSRALLNWFDRKRGLALGIALSGIGVAGIILPPLIQYLISNQGWRNTYLMMGAAALLLAWPVVFFLFRDHPSSMGLHPDGIRPAARNNEKDIQVEPGLAFSESIRTKEFWVILGSIFFLGVGGTGILVHFAALMTDRGMSPAEAAMGFSLFGFMVIVGRVSCGYLVDRYFAPHVAIGFLLGPVIGIALLAVVNDTSTVHLAAVLMGLGFGAEFDLLSYFISRYLGLKVYGKIYGLMYSGFSLGAGIGPLVMGMSYDRLGAYSVGLWCMFTAVCIGVVLVSRLGSYRYGVVETAAPAH
jgi:MFS family permease